VAFSTLFMLSAGLGTVERTCEHQACVISWDSLEHRAELLTGQLTTAVAYRVDSVDSWTALNDVIMAQHCATQRW